MGALHTPIHGVEQIVRGAKRMGKPEEGETRGGISDVLRGAMKVASPYAIPAVVANPAAAATGLAGSYLGTEAGDIAADATDASPGARELLQTGGAIAGGYAGAKYGPKAVDATMQPVKSAAAAVKRVAIKPATLKTVGTGVGAAVGSATGVGPYIGGYVGRQLGGELSDYLNTPEVPPVPQSMLDKLGITRGEFEELPEDGQQQIRDLVRPERAPMPAATPGPVDIGPKMPKGKTLDDLMREELESRKPSPQATSMPPPGPPAPKQLNAGGVVPEPPADTSGQDTGWRPTILERDPNWKPKMAAPQPTAAMPAPGSTEPPESFLDQENTGMLHDKLIANRAAKAARFVEHLGGTQNFPRTQAEWAKVSADMGEGVPSDATQAQIEAGLNKRMVAGTEVSKTVDTIPAHLQKNPKALKIARQLEESMRSTQ